jgi:AraC family transcriptional regulator
MTPQISANHALDGSRNAILRGRGRTHHVDHFQAPLSIKTVIRGHATWRTDEQLFALEPGSFLVLNDQHTYSMDMELDAEGETFCIFFQRGAIEDLARSSTTREQELVDDPGKLQQHSFVEAVIRDDDVLRAVTRLRRKIISGRTENLEAMILGVGEALVRSDHRLRELSRRVAARKSSTREELLRRLLRARDYVEGSLGSPLTLDLIARDAALSPYHLHRAFRQAFGETVHQYLTRRRLETAATLLRVSDRSILEICGAVGFVSPTSFTALFRRRYGVAPSFYRRNSQDSRGPGSGTSIRFHV